MDSALGSWLGVQFSVKLLTHGVLLFLLNVEPRLAGCSLGVTSESEPAAKVALAPFIASASS